jgi:hypothetical protein
MVLDLTGGGANPAVPDSRAVFSWNGASQSVVPILSPTADPAACRERTILVPGAPQGPFVPRHRRGDFDFVGHGPCVRLRALLRTDAENTRLSANVLMEAFECDEEERPQSDYTRVFESTSFDLFTVPAPGTTIVSHNYTQPRFTDDYRDGGHPDDIRTFVFPAMIEKIIYVGDTYGDEAGSRTGATMFFRELRVVVQECGPPASPPPG